MDYDMNYVRGKIKDLLKSRDVSQKQLAEKLGTSPTNVSKWLNNTDIPLNALVGTAEYFGLTTDTLIRSGDKLEEIKEHKMKEVTLTVYTKEDKLPPLGTTVMFWISGCDDVYIGYAERSITSEDGERIVFKFGEHEVPSTAVEAWAFMPTLGEIHGMSWGEYEKWLAE